MHACALVHELVKSEQGYKRLVTMWVPQVKGKMGEELEPERSVCKI